VFWVVVFSEALHFDPTNELTKGMPTIKEKLDQRVKFKLEQLKDFLTKLIYYVKKTSKGTKLNTIKYC